MSDWVAAALTDAELAQRIRDGNPRDRSAVEEITGRHRAVVLAYARQCCADQRAAEKLTAEAFERTLAAVRAGVGPTEVWRPYLLATTRRAAARWAGTERGSMLSAGFSAWLTTLPDPSPAEPSAEATEPAQAAATPVAAVTAAESDSLMLRAFLSLSQSQQADLWHALEEGNAAGTEPSRPETTARRRLHDAYLQTYIARARNRFCRHLAVQIADGVQRPPEDRVKDVERHLSRCAGCARTRTELTAIHTWQRPVLRRALLLWSGDPSSTPPAVTCPAPPADPAPCAPRTGARRPRAPRQRTGGRPRIGGRRVLGYSAVAGAGALAALVGAAAVLATVDAAGAHTPWADTALVPLPASSASTAGPAPTPIGQATSAAPQPSDTAAPSPGAPGALQLVNVSSGLCVGIADPATFVLQLQPCADSGSPRWERLPAGQDAYQLRVTGDGAGSGTCLDGTTGGGNVVTVVLQPCRSDPGRAEQLWKFVPGPDPGTFRLWLLPPVPSSDYSAHLLGPQDWSPADPPRAGSVLAQLPDYYDSDSFLFTLR
ncbi:hypothetical protein [Kitasatospora azatica]|uniref:hypothetical protein n=1 Tax=Kitasatospora azatica TaxID=58347 RepID=UPI0012FCD1AD|nr:hypothetical protein [Kitasatospora azatica]